MSETIIHSTLNEGYDFFFTDKWNRKHHFKVHTFSLGIRWLSEAIEVIPETPERIPRTFQVLTDIETDVEVAELRLKEKLKTRMNQRHLIKKDGRFSISGEQILRGRIEWTDLPDSGFDTAFEIDGKMITVEELLSLLEPYTGYNFKLTIVDPSDDVD